MSKIDKLSEIKLSYIAGFLDGDGSILVQIIKNVNYKYGFTIRTSIIFYQKTVKHWFMIKLKDQLKYGSIRKRKDGISEYVIVGSGPVKEILLKIKDYLYLKKDLANLTLKIIEDKKKVNSIEEFIEVCILVDKIADLTYSKKRTVTVNTVKLYNNII